MIISNEVLFRLFVVEDGVIVIDKKWMKQLKYDETPLFLIVLSLMISYATIFVLLRDNMWNIRSKLDTQATYLILVAGHQATVLSSIEVYYSRWIVLSHETWTSESRDHLFKLVKDDDMWNEMMWEQLVINASISIFFKSRT